MRIALTGATGFIGSHIARRLHKSGHAVVALVRETSDRSPIEACVERFVVGDHADERAWGEMLDGAVGVIHNSLDVRSFRANDMHASLRSNLVGSIELLLASAPLPFVFISTIAVHHDMRPRWGGAIDEDHPLRPSTMYGAYKAAVEAHLWAAHYADGRHTAAIRPCAVYGDDPTGKNIHTRPTFEAIASGEAYTRSGGGKFVHVEDVARATVSALENDAAAGRPFDLVDCYARYADLAQFAAEALGVEAEIDCSSPETPENMFACDAVRALVGDESFMQRGHDGLRTHFAELAAERAR